MLAAPYLLFVGICGLMYRAIRRARREQMTKAVSGPLAPVPENPPDPTESP